MKAHIPALWSCRRSSSKISLYKGELMKVLLSIKPEFAEKILSGGKIYEFRKVLPRAAGVKTIVIYATKPVGKVVGEFEIEMILTGSPSSIWRTAGKFGGITKEFFCSYFSGRTIAHAIKVKGARRYRTPKDLSSVLPNGIAPQSFCYIKADMPRSR
jgi:predicted transcriptional regulator